MRGRGRAGALCAALLAATGLLCTGPRRRRRGGAWPSPPSTVAPLTTGTTTPIPHSVEARIVAGMGGRV